MKRADNIASMQNDLPGNYHHLLEIYYNAIKNVTTSPMLHIAMWNKRLDSTLAYNKNNTDTQYI